MVRFALPSEPTLQDILADCGVEVHTLSPALQLRRAWTLRQLHQAIGRLTVDLCAKRHEIDGTAYQCCPLRGQNLVCGHLARGGAADELEAALDVLTSLLGPIDLLVMLRRQLACLMEELGVLDLYVAQAYITSPTERRALFDLYQEGAGVPPPHPALLEAEGVAAVAQVAQQEEARLAPRLRELREQLDVLLGVQLAA